MSQYEQQLKMLEFLMQQNQLQVQEQTKLLQQQNQLLQQIVTSMFGHTGNIQNNPAESNVADSILPSIQRKLKDNLADKQITISNSPYQVITQGPFGEKITWNVDSSLKYVSHTVPIKFRAGYDRKCGSCKLNSVCKKEHSIKSIIRKECGIDEARSALIDGGIFIIQKIANAYVTFKDGHSVGEILASRDNKKILSEYLVGASKYQGKALVVNIQPSHDKQDPRKIFVVETKMKIVGVTEGFLPFSEWFFDSKFSYDAPGITAYLSRLSEQERKMVSGKRSI